MVEIGAGGGSIAHVDALGLIAVGPESAGAEPGPACYGRGGERPAVTDANLLLGRYDPERFAGGAMRLHPDAAQDAMRAAVGTPLGIEAEMAALGVVEMVDENMAIMMAKVHFPGARIEAFDTATPDPLGRIPTTLAQLDDDLSDMLVDDCPF